MVSVRNPHGIHLDDSYGNIIIGVTVTVGIAALNPRLNIDYPLAGIYCVSALHVLRATSQSPLQLRDVAAPYYIDSQHAM